MGPPSREPTLAALAARRPAGRLASREPPASWLVEPSVLTCIDGAAGAIAGAGADDLADGGPDTIAGGGADVGRRETSGNASAEGGGSEGSSSGSAIDTDVTGIDASPDGCTTVVSSKTISGFGTERVGSRVSSTDSFSVLSSNSIAAVLAFASANASKLAVGRFPLLSASRGARAASRGGAKLRSSTGR
ncbi:MAG: hypothetical protein MUE69_27195, partial [Myxococcota bacterium]|nr:hypothetical protein [Myxococcota bacterium]